MNKITLTEYGRQLLISANADAGSEINWIGYFGLAYVPDQSKFDSGASTLIGPEENGDYIYNIWQGDMLGDGATIAAGNGLTLYDRNISSNFKYIYNERTGCNRLVTWTCDGNVDGSDGGEIPTYIRTGFKVYEGVRLGDGNNIGETTASKIPCPAPLVYLGKNRTYTSPNREWDDLGAVIGGDWPLDSDGHPMVTPDMRFYDGNVQLDNDSEFDAPTASGVPVDPYGVIASPYTRNGETLDQFGEFVSVSNFNKGHGHVSSEGYGMNTQDSCHNMSQITRLFPIGKYEIEKTQPSTSNDNVKVEEATTIKYHIELNLANAYAQSQLYESTLQYRAPQVIDTVSEEEQEDTDIFVGQHANSFKFNRIGIYAAKATLRHFIREGDSGCTDSLYQVEVSPDTPPVLFAVINIDEQCMSDNNTFGMNNFYFDFTLRLAEGEGESICKNPEVYYNLAENEAITWYQNQLLATAGISEALVGLGVNVAHLMNRVGGNGQCPSMVSTPDGTEYAPKVHTHDYMRNLVDGKVKPGAVRGIDTLPEANGIFAGEDSLVLGKGTAGCGDRLVVQGNDTIMDATCGDSVALGSDRLRASDVSRSLLLGIVPDDSADAGNTTVECDNVIGSIAVGSLYSIKNVSNSFVSGMGKSSVCVGSPNDIDVNDVIADDNAGMSDTFAILDGSRICPGTGQSLLVGKNTRFPFETTGSVILANDSNYANDDTLMTVEEFNALFISGELYGRGSGWYVLRSTDSGEHTIKVYDENAFTRWVDVTLVESEGVGCTHYNAGVYVDAEYHKVKYEPYHVRTYVAINGTETTRTLTQGDTSQYRANPDKVMHSVMIGTGNHFARNMVDSVIIGNENDFSLFDIDNCFFMGDRLLYHGDEEYYPYRENTLGIEWEGDSIRYVNHRLSNVKVWSALGNNILSKLSVANDEFATTHYSDALIFLGSGYNTPETLGIFPNPVTYKSYLPNDQDPDAPVQVELDRQNSYFYIDPTRFTRGDEHYYEPVRGTHDIHAADYDSYDNNMFFEGKTRESVYSYINKPDAPMIYTGGICLAGKPNHGNVRGNDDNSGLIKLGAGVVPCAYIDVSPVSTWNLGKDTFIPVSVTGTNECPYGGMALCIGNKQELDGTLHLSLYRRLGEAPNIYYTTYTPGEGFSVIRRYDGSTNVNLGTVLDDSHMSPVLKFNVSTVTGKEYYAHLVLDDTSGSDRVLSFKVEKNIYEQDIPSNRIDVTISGTDTTTEFNTDYPFD